MKERRDQSRLQSITILYLNSVTQGRGGCVWGRHKTIKLLDRKNPTGDHWLANREQ